MGNAHESQKEAGMQVLTRAAVDRGSRDNVTVVVVDLSPDGSETDGLTTAASAMDDVIDAVRGVHTVLNGNA